MGSPQPRRWTVILGIVISTFLSGCGNGSSDGQKNPPPIVMTIIPERNSTDVPFNSSIYFSFSDLMDEKTISTTTVFLRSSSAEVPGTVTGIGRDFFFVPAAPLAPGTVYTFTVSGNVQQAYSVPMGQDFISSFSTGSSADSTPPVVTATNPEAGATEVAIFDSISATFSEQMDASDFEFTIAANGVAMAGVFPTLVFDPGDLTLHIYLYRAGAGQITLTPLTLDWGTSYTLTIKGGQDLAGNPLAEDYSWSFTTLAAAK